MDPVTFGKKIKELYPQYKNVDDATLGRKYLNKYGAAIQGVQSKQLDIKDIPEKQRVAVGFGLSAIGAEPPKTAAETEAVVKKVETQAKIGELGQNIRVLETERQQIKNRGPLRGLIPALGGATSEEVGGFESAKNVTAYRMAEVLAGQK